jgi:hypothetical protein
VKCNFAETLDLASMMGPVAGGRRSPTGREAEVVVDPAQDLGVVKSDSRQWVKSACQPFAGQFGGEPI